MRQALVYGDVNLNILDGSAIWVQSMCEALARCDVQVRVLLKAPVDNDRLVAPLRAMPGVTVIDPFQGARTGTPLAPAEAVLRLEELNTDLRADLIVVRGWRLVTTAARSAALHGRLWTYLTDIAQDPLAMDDDQQDQLQAVAAASRYMLCQTEELRCLLESMVPAACGRSVLWSPVVPEPTFTLPPHTPVAEDGTQRRPISLVYTGKFAPLWNTLPMTTLPATLAEHGIAAELHMIGDKIHEVPGDPEWSTAMRSALENSPGVIWHGGMPRQDAMELTARADLGLSWRDPLMDASLELSTKVLEFGVLGVPALLNRTPMHVDLLGDTYPFYVSSDADIVTVCRSVIASTDVLDRARADMTSAVAPYTMSASTQRMSTLLDRALPAAPPELAGRERLRVAVVSHDLKFFTRIQEHLEALPQIELRLDHWPALASHDVGASEEMVEWADVVICEWAGPNLVWYSQNKRADQRLIVRLHRFELDAGWLNDVRIDAVDQVVCVSPFYAQLTAARTGWPAEKIVVIPNWVDVDQFDRPKLADAQFTLGMIGISPHRKRPDLGLEVLSRLRRRDRRFRMAIKSKLPWDYWWIWRKPEERHEAERLFDRIHSDPTIRGAVSFDGFGGDVPAWLRRVGWVLSTSDDESFHLAPAEGMASGAVPALLPWPGSDTIYDTRWIHADPVTMADWIHDIVESEAWESTARQAREQVEASFPLPAVCDEWARIVVGNLSPDTAHGTLAR